MLQTKTMTLILLTVEAQEELLVSEAASGTSSDAFSWPPSSTDCQRLIVKRMIASKRMT